MTEQFLGKPLKNNYLLFVAGLGLLLFVILFGFYPLMGQNVVIWTLVPAGFGGYLLGRRNGTLLSLVFAGLTVVYLMGQDVLTANGWLGVGFSIVIAYFYGRLGDIKQTNQLDQFAYKRKKASGFLGNTPQALFSELSQTLTENSYDYVDMLQLMTKRLTDLLGDSASIFLPDDENQAIHFVSTHHKDSENLTLIKHALEADNFYLGQDSFERLTSKDEALILNQLSGETLRDGISPKLIKTLKLLSIGRILLVPLRTKDQIVGYIAITRKETDRPFTHYDATFLQGIGDRAVLWILNAQLAKKLARESQSREVAEALNLEHYHRSVKLAEFSKQVGRVGIEEDEILSLTAANLSGLFNKPAAIFFINETNHSFAIRAIQEPSGQDSISSIADQLFGNSWHQYKPTDLLELLAAKKQILISDPAGSYWEELGLPKLIRPITQNEIANILLTPLTLQSNLIGLVALIGKKKDAAFDETSRAFVQNMVDRTANALGTARLNRSLQLQLNARREFEAGIEHQGRIFQAVSDSVFSLDREFRITAMNKAAETLFDVSAEDVIGTKAGEFVNTANLDEVVGAISKGENWSGELGLTLPAGDQIQVHSSISIIRDADGQPIGATSISRDITTLKQVEAQQRYQAHLMGIIPDALIATDAEHRITNWNKAATDIYGWQAPEAIGNRLYDLIETSAVHDEMTSILMQFRATGAWSGEMVQTRKDGRQINVLSSIRTVLDEDGNQIGILAINRDITNQKAFDEALQQSQKLESIGVLAGGIAHDFNNLLTGVLGQSSLALAKLEPSSKAEKHINRAISAAENAANLTRQLLAYAGKGQYLIERVDLNDQIETNQGLFDVALSRGTTLDLDLDNSLPQIEADKGHIQQVIMNLILNAAEAVEGNNGLVKVKTASVTIGHEDALDTPFIGKPVDPGDYVQFVVEDNGSGMPQEMIERIFDPYFSTKGSGRGLGLSATLGIIQSYEGGLQVHSVRDEGTKFTVSFPALMTESAESKPEISPKSKSTMNGTSEKLLLVIDDEDNVREAVSDILELIDVKVIEARNGKEGVELYKAHRANIGGVLLDMQMPVMSGEETFYALREINPDIKVIISSGYSETETMQHFVGQGLAAFLQKPYQIETLMNQVQTVLGLQPN